MTTLTHTTANAPTTDELTVLELQAGGGHEDLPLTVRLAIADARADATAQKRVLRMLVRAGEMLAIDADHEAHTIDAQAARTVARLVSVQHSGQASTLDLATWDAAPNDASTAGVLEDLHTAGLL